MDEKGKQAGGEQEGRKPWTLRDLWGKPVWEWLDLLIVPLFIAVSIALLGWSQSYSQQRVEEERAQQTTLQAYLDQMGSLLIERNLRNADMDSNVRNFARARTLTTLDALNAARKKRVLRFLEETELLRRAELSEEESITDDCPQGKLPSLAEGKQPVISLKYARLGGVDLSRRGGLLGGIDLQQADLANAGLDNANLSNNSLRGANLFEADLRHANLTGTDLRGACLGNTNLRGAILHRATVTKDQLDQAAFLDGATMPDGQKYEDWLKSKG